MKNGVTSTKLFWARYIELALCFLAFGWCVSDFGWESAAAFVAIFVTLAGSEVAFIRTHFKVGETTEAAKRSPIEGQQAEDKELYQRLITLLPADGIIKFIKEWNMAGFPFPIKNLDPLEQFLQEWTSSTHEFLDPDIEDARKNLYTYCREYSRLIAEYTYPTSNGRQGVPAEWEFEEPEKFDRAVKALNAKSDQIADAHTRLVRIARRRLNL